MTILTAFGPPNTVKSYIIAIRWDENAGLRRDAVRSQLSTRLKRKNTRIKETGNEED